MGWDCGFDIFPRIEPTPENKKAYKQFIDAVINKYQGVYDDDARSDDKMILSLPGDATKQAGTRPDPYIRLMIGECPSMPADPEHCNYFMRFSSKVSGRLTSPAEKYIYQVYDIAKRFLGGNVCFWHEGKMTYAPEEEWDWHYDWGEVYKVEKELRDLVEAESSKSGPEGEGGKPQTGTSA